MNRSKYQKKISGKSVLQKDNSNNRIVADSITMLRANDFDDYYIEQFSSGTALLLNDYADMIGEGTEVEYTLKKKISKIELRMQAITLQRLLWHKACLNSWKQHTSLTA